VPVPKTCVGMAKFAKGIGGSTAVDWKVSLMVFGQQKGGSELKRAPAPGAPPGTLAAKEKSIIIPGSSGSSTGERLFGAGAEA